MTKEELIQKVQESSAGADLKEMVIGYINTAHSIGFQAGWEKANLMHAQVFDVLMKPRKEVSHV